MALSRVGDGEQNIQLDARSKNEIGDLARGFNQMITKLRSSDIETSRNNWLTEGANSLNDCMQGDLVMADLTRNIITFMCSYIDAQIGVFYVVEDQLISASATYGTSLDEKINQKTELGVGLVGQVALDQKLMVVSDIPDGYLSITSGLGKATPNTLIIVPFMWNNNVVAVMEIGTIGTIGRISELQQCLFDVVSTAIATAVQTAKSRDQTKTLLAQTQTQTEELRVSEEELQDKNSLLERQTQELKKSQMELEESNEKLQTQQEELRIANEELYEKADELKHSRGLLEDKNQSLEEVRVELERRAEELTTSSKYKSEFLSNMSHELRTPLNSLLILARMLADNKDNNLSEKQVKFSRTIYDSGNDLLSLINDILDLSKIESGKTELEITSIDLDEFSAELQSRFQPVAENKGISFEIDSKQAPDVLKSDDQKLSQVLKNFISNAIKFTHSGTVKLKIGPVPDKITLTTAGLNRDNSLAFTVSDTGIGIPEDKKGIIFEAFQQVDGSTSRKYGGTGLGLSISRELTRLLGGEIHLDTKEGKGSSFILIIPAEVRALEQEVSATGTDNTSSGNATDEEAIISAVTLDDEALVADETVVADSTPTPVPVSHVTEQAIADNRNDLLKGERSILIVEDDLRFAAILADYATERGFKILVVDDGKTALHFADFYQPSGIILDIGLPGIDGWQVMEVLKSNSATRHIPVHFMSAHSSTMQAMSTGAVGFLTKPVSQEDMEQAFDSIEWVIDRSVKRLLLIEDDPIQSMSLRELIGSGDVETVTADSGARAMKLLTSETFDCIVLDLGLPDMSGMQLLEDIRSQENLKKIPIIVYTGKELETQERDRLNLFAQDIIIKDVRSPERLLDDTVLFLHRIEENLPDESRETIRMLHDAEALFANQKILVVDDDMRNIFSLCAVLEDKKMQTITAKDGIEALEQLERHPDIKLVLMDIMMPRMDGYEACREIRKQKRFADLPIVALTAKAMKGDRNLCIQAGANDYITKPIIIDKLLSMMRVWLYR
jgi:tubulin-specific chaperone A